MVRTRSLSENAAQRTGARSWLGLTATVTPPIARRGEAQVHQPEPIASAPCTTTVGSMRATCDPAESPEDDAAPDRALRSAPSSPRQYGLLTTLFLIIATALVPWIVYLGLSLPPKYDAGHWNLLWVGFDVALVGVLGFAAWAAWFGRQVLASTAVVAGTLLICDAWFDIITSIGRPGEWVTLLTGLGCELPLAAFFFWLYRRLTLEMLAALHQRLGDGTPPRRLRRAELLSPSARSRPDRGPGDPTPVEDASRDDSGA